MEEEAEHLYSIYGGNRTGGEGETHQGMMGTPATWPGEHNAPGRDHLAT